ncbi:Uncharacterized protein FKW44_012911 [Caligus rogercresseyi]|uniref:Uncharacterized protein n=1 Tax=Caligus rogercresseyi TaxID=217165 RepID=A0A7T8K9W7_CALRO|nr:Uncharacterized protein FKW44_012911 [Caligus rogercresseyi]
MQIKVDPSCSKDIVLRIANRPYELARLGFGLNYAPEIMKSVVSEVLRSDEKISEATGSYFDVIIVDVEKVAVDDVRALLSSYGLVFNEPVPLENAKVLGLQIRKGNSDLAWCRPEEESFTISEDDLTKRELFSICGKLVGHYAGWQVAGWYEWRQASSKDSAKQKHGGIPQERCLPICYEKSFNASQMPIP